MTVRFENVDVVRILLVVVVVMMEGRVSACLDEVRLGKADT